jgi:hypothetical protein
MILIIAGSRTFENIDELYDIADWIDAEWGVSMVVSGHAKGPDQMGEAWAAERGLPVEVFLAKWDKQGKAAGVIRNRQMADWTRVTAARRNEPAGLLAFHEGGSPGTKNMIMTAQSMDFDFILTINVKE